MAKGSAGQKMALRCQRSSLLTFVVLVFCLSLLLSSLIKRIGTGNIKGDQLSYLRQKKAPSCAQLHRNYHQRPCFKKCRWQAREGRGSSIGVQFCPTSFYHFNCSIFLNNAFSLVPHFLNRSLSSSYDTISDCRAFNMRAAW